MVDTELVPVQFAYHVPDPAAAARHYAAAFGWGPFFLMEHIPLARSMYRGQRAVFDHSSAYGQAGSLMIEFITQHGDQPSALRDLYSATQSGLHHVASFVPDLPAALAAFRGRGYEAALEARTATGVEFEIIDTSRELGHMIEIYEPVGQLKRFYQHVRKASHDWDGRDPVRRLGG
jgi:catechol 2,3-dioxygenase-like lactoylglutathione lyase family enzyme